MSIRVGLVGTGYAAGVRANTFLSDRRSELVAVAGRDELRAVEFARRYGIAPTGRWINLVEDDRIDLVVVCTVSALHGDVVESALKVGKHVVVEYPLSLDVAQAERLLKLARQHERLLHVEHVELLGGLHQELRSHLPAIGFPSYLTYRTLRAQRPSPLNWKYSLDLFGFPFCGALSRLSRLIDLFGLVASVSCDTQIAEADNSSFYTTILCSGRLRFESGLIAEVTYGKGDQVWTSERTISIHGSDGALSFVGNKGILTTADREVQIKASPRKGLIALDTQGVLDYLSTGEQLYVSAEESLYALQVGDALRRASTHQSVVLMEEIA